MEPIKIEPMQTRNEAEMSQRNCLCVNYLKTKCAPTEIVSRGATLRNHLQRPADYGGVSGGKLHHNPRINVEKYVLKVPPKMVAGAE